MDTDTKKIVGDNKFLQEMIDHEGWKIARQLFTQKIVELSNILSLEETDPNKLMIEIQARRYATNLLWDFIREIEGSRDVVETNKVTEQTSFIVRID